MYSLRLPPAILMRLIVCRILKLTITLISYDLRIEYRKDVLDKLFKKTIVERAISNSQYNPSIEFDSFRIFLRRRTIIDIVHLLLRTGILLRTTVKKDRCSSGFNWN